MLNINIKKINLKNLILNTAQVIIVTEFLAAFVLISWIIVLKHIDRTDLRMNVMLFTNDLPYGLNNLIFKQKSKLDFEADPHLVFYSTNLRFGEHKDWIKNRLDNKTFNIIIVGGSTVHGDGARSRDYTIAAQLENYLNINKLGGCRRIKVINEGISGYHAKSQYFLLTYGLIPYINPNNINMVISLDGVNDFLGWTSNRKKNESHPFIEQLGTRELESKAVMDKYFTGDKAVNAAQFYKLTFVGRLALSIYDTIFIKQKGVVDIFGHRPDLSKFEPSIEERVNSYLYWKRLTNSTLNEFKIKSYQFVQPYIGYKRDLTEFEYSIRNKNDKFTETFWKNFDTYYNNIIQKTKSIDYMINISDLFQEKKEELFIDHVHYTEYAQKIIASKIGEILIKEINCK